MKTCTKCKEEKEVSKFEKTRNVCRECRSKQAKGRRNKLKTENPVLYFSKQMASSAYARVKAPSRKHKKGYQNLNNPSGFGNIPEMTNYLYNSFYDEIYKILKEGESPSVDRLNHSVGYCKGNIQIISHYNNSMDGLTRRRKSVLVTFKDNTTKYFKSTVDCVVYFGFSEKSTSKVKSWARKDGLYKLPDNVLSVEYMDNIDNKTVR